VPSGGLSGCRSLYTLLWRSPSGDGGTKGVSAALVGAQCGIYQDVQARSGVDNLDLNMMLCSDTDYDVVSQSRLGCCVLIMIMMLCSDTDYDVVL